MLLSITTLSRKYKYMSYNYIFIESNLYIFLSRNKAKIYEMQVSVCDPLFLGSKLYIIYLRL